MRSGCIPRGEGGIGRGDTQLLLLARGTAFAMVSVIWTVRLSHYPLFSAVGDTGCGT